MTDVLKVATTHTTNTTTPTCLLDELSSSLTCAGAVRLMSVLWSLPAALLAVAGYRYVFDRPPSSVVAAYIDVGRASVVVLAAFTLVVGGIWLVRSGLPLPSVRRFDGTWMSWSGHVRFGGLAAAALVGSLAAGSSTVGLALAMLACGAGLISGLVIPRWMLAVGNVGLRDAFNQSNRAVVAAALMAAVIVFEVTIGWGHSTLMSDGASVLSGWVALTRGVVLAAAIANMVLSGRPENS